MSQKTSLQKKCKKIKLIISDVDGVLTDGGMYYSEKGEVMKKFNTRDGMGIELLKGKIKTILMSRENSKIVLKRGKKIKVDEILIGIKNKELFIPKICKKYKVIEEEIAYIGDDVNDFEIMKKVGLTASPNDGMEKIRKISDYVCNLKGGEGVFREFIELILSNRDDIKITKK